MLDLDRLAVLKPTVNGSVCSCIIYTTKACQDAATYSLCLQSQLDKECIWGMYNFADDDNQCRSFTMCESPPAQ